jgi:hypothetical protein
MLFVLLVLALLGAGGGLAVVAITRRRAALRAWDAELAVALARDEPRAPLLAPHLGRHRGTTADA